MHKLVSLAVVVASSALAMEPVGLTEDEYKMYRHAKLAMDDPRVQAMKEPARLPAIAKDAGFKLKDLKSALEKGDAAGDFKGKCEANVRESLDAAFKGRVAKVEIDTSAEHAVAYVEWLNEEQKNLPLEACLVAAKAADACPIASSIQVWAADKANPKTRVFQALISQSGAHRINVEKAKDYAETRYLKLFEKVKNAANGDDLSDAAAAAPTAAPVKP
jgi:hypothetical protein